MTFIMRTLGIALVVGAAAVFAASCGADSTSPSAASLLATTTVTPAVFHSGKVVAVHVIVTNRGSVPRTIDVNLCPDPFLVSSAAGTVVGPADRTCTADARQKSLAPGEQFSFDRAWINGPVTAGLDTASSNLPMGSYQVRGRLTASDVDAPSVTVQIVP